MRQEAVNAITTKELFGVVVFGWYKVGKTALITKFTDGTFEKDEYRPSPGLGMYVKHGYQYRTRVLEAQQYPVAGVGVTGSDTPKQTREHELGRDAEPHSGSETVDYLIFEATDTGCTYARRDWVYTRMNVIILTYSITDPFSFQSARNILARAREHESKAKIFLVGLLADCKDAKEVTFGQGEKLAHEFGVVFRELSALDDAEGVERLFGDVAGFLVVRDKKVKVEAGSEEGPTVWERMKAFIPWS
ncbi:P-loop containing nucleoside triphosphate hydrolase protein [Aspergillus insuetus]